MLTSFPQKANDAELWCFLWYGPYWVNRLTKDVHSYCNADIFILALWEFTTPDDCQTHFIQFITFSWWRHQMKTFSALLAICAGNPPVPGEFPAQRPVTRSFDVFFDLRLNKRLSKQSLGWWFETLSRSFWRHCNGTLSRQLHICFSKFPIKLKPCSVTHKRHSYSENPTSNRC